MRSNQTQQKNAASNAISLYLPTAFQCSTMESIIADNTNQPTRNKIVQPQNKTSLIILNKISSYMYVYYTTVLTLSSTKDIVYLD